MINLNLDYEQSKKILELGYDFGKVCNDFQFHNDKLLKRINQSFAINITITEKTLRRYPDDVMDYVYHLATYEIIPIIPKAALLQSLPIFSRLVISDKLEGLIFRTDSDFKFVHLEEIHSGNVFKTFETDELREAILEAFLWCHENYPEELKKKFEEVMG